MRDVLRPGALRGRQGLLAAASGVESRFILEGIDVDEKLGGRRRSGRRTASRSRPSSWRRRATTWTGTLSEAFVETVINVLRSHPHAVYLLIGDGELAWQKRQFESAGVGKRVGYAGRRKDLPGFLRIADMYLAEFPASGATGVLQAMAVEKPVVAMRWGDRRRAVARRRRSSGSEGTITGRDPAAYIERVSKIIREPAYRQKLGKTMQQRVEQHFAFNQTARHIEQLCDQLIQAKSESAGAPAREDAPKRNPLWRTWRKPQAS